MGISSNPGPFALISVFHKEGILPLAQVLEEKGYQILSTGGTAAHLREAGLSVTEVEDLTSFPSILGGRVKTLHPKIFGGILHRREVPADLETLGTHAIPSIDVVVVDLYPFAETVANQAEHQEIIEKIDIGGISLIRATAKNYQDCLIVPSRRHYPEVTEALREGKNDLPFRKRLAAEAFALSSAYDQSIQNYLHSHPTALPLGPAQNLRYGENPHQKGAFFGDLGAVFAQLHGKELSYNNLLDIDAAIQLIGEFEEPTVGILKHNNACGLASRNALPEAWEAALAADPVSAFGGIIISNRTVDAQTAEKMHQIFFEVILAPQYAPEALEILKGKKNRIILQLKDFSYPEQSYRSALNGFLAQQRDEQSETEQDLVWQTSRQGTREETEDLLFAAKIAKHTKSNTIILAKEKQLLGGGTGQTSRVDALKQAIAKAQQFGFDLQGAVMASDAFFPFPDSVEIAWKAGIQAVIQPGGSVKDQLSIDFCEQNQMAMAFTGRRHFKH